MDKYEKLAKRIKQMRDDLETIKRTCTDDDREDIRLYLARMGKELIELGHSFGNDDNQLDNASPKPDN